MKFFTSLSALVLGASLLGLSATAQTTSNNRAESYPRSTVVEVFTGEWCGWCPLGKFFIEKAVKALPEADQDRVIISYFHDGDFIFQQFPDVKKATSTYEAVFGIPGFPSGLIDRTKTNTFGKIVFAPTAGDSRIVMALKERLETDAPGIVDFSLTKEGDEFTMNITGELAASVSEDVFVTSYLIRDNIAQKKQKNYVKSAETLGGDVDLYNEYMAFWGNYKHDHTMLQLLTPAQGEKITPESNGKFTLSKTFSQNFGSYNTEDYSYAVVILHYKNSTKKGIINAAKKALFAEPTSISDIVANENIKVYAANGDIVIEGEYKSFRVFDMEGHMYSDTKLNAGIYIVSIETNAGQVIKKVVVK